MGICFVTSRCRETYGKPAPPSCNVRDKRDYNLQCYKYLKIRIFSGWKQRICKCSYEAPLETTSHHSSFRKRIEEPQKIQLKSIQSQSGLCYDAAGKSILTPHRWNLCFPLGTAAKTFPMVPPYPCKQLRFRNLAPT